MTDDDLRAAVSAGIVTEAQAARLLTLSQTRAGTRAALTGDDEPFELFKGFSEIFISVGLVILIGGISVLAGLVTVNPMIVPVVGAVLAAALAGYFSRRRRMVLPSIVLTIGFYLFFGASVALAVFGELDQVPGRNEVILSGLIVVAALAVWFRLFVVPFTMALIGITALLTLQLAISPLAPVVAASDWRLLFDLSAGSRLALGTFGFGIAAFALGMWYDMRDPHRLGRHSATGFWLHVLAAPALVNTVALTFLNMESTTGHVLLALALLVITLLALVIDRRSFLTAGIAYVGILLGLVLQPEGEGGAVRAAVLLIVLGGFITLTGAFWTAWRGAILRALPDFPGKSRLPPYAG